MKATFDTLIQQVNTQLLHLGKKRYLGHLNHDEYHKKLNELVTYVESTINSSNATQEADLSDENKLTLPYLLEDMFPDEKSVHHKSILAKITHWLKA